MGVPEPDLAPGTGQRAAHLVLDMRIHALSSIPARAPPSGATILPALSRHKTDPPRSNISDSKPHVVIDLATHSEGEAEIDSSRIIQPPESLCMVVTPFENLYSCQKAFLQSFFFFGTMSPKDT